jgi:hypothetical protein
VLVFVVGCLIIYSAYAPAIRVPVLIAAAVEKFALGLLVFFGPVKRTSGMTTSAVVDGVFAILYVVYLVGLAGYRYECACGGCHHEFVVWCNFPWGACPCT